MENIPINFERDIKYLFGLLERVYAILYKV